MNRIEYMQELERLLADIPSEEREDAINYYNDYFDAGGEENEEETIAALGSPEQLASTIKLANSSDQTIDGEFTEAGYIDNLRRDANELDKYTRIDSVNADSKKNKKSPGMIALIIILAIFALPILAPIAIAILAVVFALLVSVVATMFGIAVAVVSVGVGVFIAGIAGICVAIGTFASNFFSALCIMGVSLIALGLGLFFILFCVNIVVKAIPPVARWFVKIMKGIVSWFGGIFKRKEKKANEEF